jgi:putative hydrolase of the HAD superfamily
MSAPVTHVFFDAASTLLRVRGSVGAIYAEVAARHGIHADAGGIEARFPAAMRSVPLDVEPGLPPAERRRRERAWWSRVVRCTSDSFAAAPGFEAFLGELFEAFRGTAHWEVLPHVRETLATLHGSGYHLGIISGMDARLVDVLAGFGLARCFETVTLASDAGYPKSDPRLFRDALAAAGATPEQSAHVGDSVVNDARPALELGMRAVLVGVDYPIVPAGALQIRDLSALVPCLRSLE